MISAGFDAHIKDDVNCGYVGIDELDYQWVTDAIVQVFLPPEMSLPHTLTSKGRFQLLWRTRGFLRSLMKHTRCQDALIDSLALGGKNSWWCVGDNNKVAALQELANSSEA